MHYTPTALSALLLLSLPALTASGQQPEKTDSMKSQNLNEVVIEANRQYTTPTSTVYVPTKRQKNAAQNAVDLLRQMSIPQLQIDPMTEAVTDNGGIEVSIFINWLPASKEEMEGLRTADVRKVEYLEFPTDPRFRGAQRAVNIIIQEYLYGGYTKLTASENVLTGLSSRANVFSKFTYRKMTYDIFAGANNSDSHHGGSDTYATYRLSDPDGNPYTVTRNQEALRSHGKDNRYPVTLRATYNSKKVQIRNTLSYTYSGTPVGESSGALSYNTLAGQSYTWERSNPSRSNSLSYGGNFFFVLPRDWSVDATARFNYSHSNDRMSYLTSVAPAIDRHARENAYEYRVSAYLQKKIGKKHVFSLGLDGGEDINRLRYTGTDNYTDRFSLPFLAASVAYQLRTGNVRLYSDFGFAREGNKINGVNHNDYYPYFHLNANWSVNTHNQLSTYMQYATNSPGISAKSSDVLKDNEFMYISGNPHLDNARHVTLNLAYTWLPSNALSVTAYGNYYELFDHMLTMYEPYKDGAAILRTYINDGNFIRGNVGLAVNWKPLGDKLQIYFAPRQNFKRSTGIYDKSCNPFTATVQVNWYAGNFFMQGSYTTPSKDMWDMAPKISRNRSRHSITAGWANSSWNIRLMAANFFNKGWRTSSAVIDTPYYSEVTRSYGTSAHPRINLSVTYTFDYGKKIKRNNEIGEQQGAQSAILK